MRNASLAVLREIGVDTGGSNVQVAINPENGRMIIIEMNPRVSRSPHSPQGDRFPSPKWLPNWRLATPWTNCATKLPAAPHRPVPEPRSIMWFTKVPRFAFENSPGTGSAHHADEVGWAR